MHPEILRELHSQHNRDMQQWAQRAQLGRTVRRTLRAMRRSTHVAETDELVVPAIPDYVDGSFRTTGDQAAGKAQGQVPAARHAA
jgi:hypothetical protein